MRRLEAGYDYIIIGGGSAGCVLAGRLSENPDCTVLLLEAGPRDGGLMMRMPAGVYSVYKDRRINWNYESTPQAELAGRHIPVPRGRVLGGSSSINALVYLRGHRDDYDGWARAGLSDWSFDRCLPYFRRSETSDRGENHYRGGSGPLSVTTGKTRSPIFDAFFGAAERAGHRLSNDLNGADPVGFGRMDATIAQGRRCSAAVAYLHPVAHRRNLTVATGAVVDRIVIEAGSATGVAVTQAGLRQILRAEREVILSAGAINSPQLLMLSGVGPADELGALGIAVQADSPEVGRNLQDHLNLGLSFRCAKPVSLAWIGSPLGKATVGSRWLLRKDGPAASNIWEVGGFARTDPADALPSMHYHLGAMMIEPRGDGFRLAHGFMLHMAQLRQKSRGRVTLRSADPCVPPLIDFGFFSEPADLAELRAGLKLTRDLVQQPELRALGATEAFPGDAVRSDAEIDAMLRQNINTEFHPSCTCRMGIDQGSVVDPLLSVRGVDRLRVIDASVMPNIVGANLNATVIMIAEKASEYLASRI